LPSSARKKYWPVCSFLLISFVLSISVLSFLGFSSLLFSISSSHILVFYCYPSSSLFPFPTIILLIINIFSFNNFLSPTLSQKCQNLFISPLRHVLLIFPAFKYQFVFKLFL
jgi:hypothetical protein